MLLNFGASKYKEIKAISVKNSQYSTIVYISCNMPDWIHSKHYIAGVMYRQKYYDRQKLTQ